MLLPIIHDKLDSANLSNSILFSRRDASPLPTKANLSCEEGVCLEINGMRIGTKWKVVGGPLQVFYHLSGWRMTDGVYGVLLGVARKLRRLCLGFSLRCSGGSVAVIALLCSPAGLCRYFCSLEIVVGNLDLFRMAIRLSVKHVYMVPVDGFEGGNLRGAVGTVQSRFESDFFSGSWQPSTFPRMLRFFSLSSPRYPSVLWMLLLPSFEL
ncbi:hypothetical protein F2Q70_00008598 [Brassica cretica]|uniref:Uncharacterized protein n=1 Tax=Brassica cretica TaxID=69181 RepID=A0A8S9JFF4_BRACR|nr:hypothetical protein F2Q68_00001654 [Brassica cretica]KAF2616024.1 hypothetical protein F2Q70_00008598 [Brassica cretica]